MTPYQTLIERIIREQELVIGPIAWVEARKVPGLKVVDEKKGELSIDGDGKQVLEGVVRQYERLFGLASREVCKSAIVDLLPTMQKSEIPDILL